MFSKFKTIQPTSVVNIHAHKIQHICILRTINLVANGKKMNLQARTKSARWLGPKYLYWVRASQTTSKNFSLRMTIVVRLLYNSKFTELPVSIPFSDDKICRIELMEPSFRSSIDSTILMNSNTLRLI